MSTSVGGASVGGVVPVAALPDIPVLDCTRGRAVDVARELSTSMAAILAIAGQQYTPMGLRAGDAISRRWLARNANPYLEQIIEVSAAVGPGAILLNCAYEWACTTGTRPGELGQTMLRVLDWDMAGLGRYMAVVQHMGTGGAWLNMTWPGYVGCITGLAPGRFAAAINQPPPPATGMGMIADWGMARPDIWRSRALPPSHLLRQVFDEAKDYQAALDMLVKTPISTPAFYTLSGCGPDQGCVVERGTDTARVRTARTGMSGVAVANHWSDAGDSGNAPVGCSPARQGLMEHILATEPNPLTLDWLGSPILNDYTRMVAVANAAQGVVLVQGWEGSLPVTRPLCLG